MIAVLFALAIGAIAFGFNRAWRQSELSEQELKLHNSFAHAPLPMRPQCSDSPKLPVGMLYTVILPAPKDVLCSQPSGVDRVVEGRYVEDDGAASYPLHGWVGCTNGVPVVAMTVECFTADGKVLLASTTTNARGKFSFPTLKEGTYYLKARAEGASALGEVVRTTRNSQRVPCLVAEAER